MTIRKFDVGAAVALSLAILGGVFWLGDLSGRIDSIDLATVNRRITEVEDAIHDFERGQLDLLPIGSVVQSVLPLALFSATVGETGVFVPDVSKWAPCDGRAIAGSRLTKKGGESTAPDMRGAFVRGLNRFGSDESSPVAANRADPDGLRAIGGYQADGVGAHTHTVQDSHGAHPGAWGPISGEGNQNGSTNRTTSPPSPSPGETRPKNVALFFYVKIN